MLLPTATDPQPVPADAEPDDYRLFFNRELSWLDFNWRVLHQAKDPSVPLLDRIRFLAITASNLDEFFRKRVGGLKRQAAAGVRTLSPDGRTPHEQLVLIRRAVEPMNRRLSDLWDQELRRELGERAGIYVRDYADLNATQQASLEDLFDKHIFPVLTPLAVDPGHPFPFISNLSLSLAVLLRHPTHGSEHFARIKAPTAQGRFVQLDDEVYVPVEQVIAHHAVKLFRGMEVVAVHPFRITRNADVNRDEEEADDLLEMMSEELRERRFAPVVRLEVDADAPRRLHALLLDELALGAEDVYLSHGIIDLADCIFFAGAERPELKLGPWTPIEPPRLAQEEATPTEGAHTPGQGQPESHPGVFDVIRDGDLLLHHPYESFRKSVQRLLEEAADDPHVRAIKQTLYRTSEDSPIVRSLVRAAERGKEVAVLVEVKARFDEQNNIDWGQMMEKAGVHVTYGLVGLKTHAKVTLILREEGEGVRPYCHIGTGNYNPATARTYTDLGLMTCRPDVGADVVNLFHYLTGYAPEQLYEKLIVAPRNMREVFLAHVRQEATHQQAGGRGWLIAKMNALDDVELITELYRASRAGVRVDLIVRGHCRLRPGLEGFSEHIRVRSILGRFLEHSRIYAFNNGGNPRIFIGSADWQRRNLEDRLEVVVEVEDPALRERLHKILQLACADTRTGWDLQPNGQYALDASTDVAGFQEQLMHAATRNWHPLRA